MFLLYSLTPRVVKHVLRKTIFKPGHTPEVLPNSTCAYAYKNSRSTGLVNEVGTVIHDYNGYIYTPDLGKKPEKRNRLTFI